MYNSKSNYADEFISHEEIIDTLDWLFRGTATSNYLFNSGKAGLMRGLIMRSGSTLMCDDQEIKSQIFNLARKIKTLKPHRHNVNRCTYLITV